MRVSETVVITGSGPSAISECSGIEYPWPTGVPVMAVSSGWRMAPEFAHFCTLDRPFCFPDWLLESVKMQKHVPANKMLPRWQRHPMVQAWAYEDGNCPDFTSRETPCVVGPLPRNHSLLFAVQVAAKLGFTRLAFIGCDLTLPELYPICDTLESWYPAARAAGIEWLNLSPLSHLAEWMPAATVEDLTCPRCVS